MESIVKFWKFFQGNIAALESGDSSVMDELLVLLHQIDKRLYYHLGWKGNQIDLIFSIEGNVDLIDVVEGIIEKGPDLVKWKYLTYYDSSIFLGKRNEILFPDDENGNILYAIARKGVNLALPRKVDFVAVFDFKKFAKNYKKDIGEIGFTGEINEYNGGYEVNTQVYISPIHSEITEIEHKFAQIAEKNHGNHEGWGFFD